MNRTLYKANIATRDAHPAPADGFAGIELQGRHYDERVAAGEALLNILPTVQDTQTVHIGSLRGFDVEVSLEAFGKHFLALKGEFEYEDSDARGNISARCGDLAPFPLLVLDILQHIFDIDFNCIIIENILSIQHAPLWR